jgi:hypothetical protein
MSGVASQRLVAVQQLGILGAFGERGQAQILDHVAVGL